MPVILRIVEIDAALHIRWRTANQLEMWLVKLKPYLVNIII